MAIYYISEASKRPFYIAWAILAFVAASTLAYVLGSSFVEPSVAGISTPHVATVHKATNRKPAAIVIKLPTPVVTNGQINTKPVDQSEDLFVNLSRAHREMLETKNASRSVDEIILARSRFVAQNRNSRDEFTAEQNLGDYLARSASSPLFDIISSACGAIVCEVQGRVYSDLPMEDWSKMIGGMQTLPWWGQFSSVSTMTSEQNGQLVAITYLYRQSANVENISSSH